MEDVETARFSREALVPVPAPGPGVCSVCSGPSEGPRCPSCVALFGTTGLDDVPVVPVTMTTPRGEVAVELRNYKDSMIPHARDLAARKLSWLLERFLSRHEHCVAGAAGALQFDAVVPVPEPGPARVTGAPLAWLLAETPWIGDRVRLAVHEATEPVPPPTAHHASLDRGSYRVDASEVKGLDVLVVDNLWIDGAEVMSVAAAIQAAGARSVLVIVLSRLVADLPLASTTGAVLGRGGFDPVICARCAPARVQRNSARQVTNF